MIFRRCSLWSSILSVVITTSSTCELCCWSFANPPDFWPNTPAIPRSIIKSSVKQSTHHHGALEINLANSSSPFILLPMIGCNEWYQSIRMDDYWFTTRFPFSVKTDSIKHLGIFLMICRWIQLWMGLIFTNLKSLKMNPHHLWSLQHQVLGYLRPKHFPENFSIHRLLTYLEIVELRTILMLWHAEIEGVSRKVAFWMVMVGNHRKY